MGAPSEPRLVVLHALRLKGLAEVPTVAEVAGDGLDPAPLLDELGAAGLAVRREGRLAGWSLTAGGRAELTRLLAEELRDAGAADVVRDAYERFRLLNPRMLHACTRWQVRDDGGRSEVNDHSDAAYDAAVVAELDEIHHGIRPVLADLAAALGRFARYLPGLAAALARVHAGEAEMFTAPGVPSYHTLWFELHEDLLATLAIERSSEVPV